MKTTISVESDKIYINYQPLEDLFKRFYEQGKQDAYKFADDEKITLQQLQKQLDANGRKISVQSLKRKAEAANVQVLAFDGKRLAVYKKDLKHFIAL